MGRVVVSVTFVKPLQTVTGEGVIVLMVVVYVVWTMVEAARIVVVVDVYV